MKQVNVRLEDEQLQIIQKYADDKGISFTQAINEVILAWSRNLSFEEILESCKSINQMTMDILRVPN